MNEYPKMLYKYPGTVQLQDGCYGMLTVQDETEEHNAIDAGYSYSPATARAAEVEHRTPPKPPSPEAPTPVGKDKGKWV